MISVERVIDPRISRHENPLISALKGDESLFWAIRGAGRVLWMYGYGVRLVSFQKIAIEPAVVVYNVIRKGEWDVRDNVSS